MKIAAYSACKNREYKCEDGLEKRGQITEKKPSHRCDSQHVPRGNEEEDRLERRRQIPDTLQPHALDSPPFLIEGAEMSVAGRK